MSSYQFLPSKPRQGSTEPFVTWTGGFTDEEIKSVIDICDRLERKDAQVGGGDDGVVDPTVRRTKVGWLQNTAESAWLYDRMAFIARSLNSQFYRFDLYGFYEDFQYTVYEEGDEGFYTWHLDHGVSCECPRKLSLVLQLSSPDEYEGGELQIMTSSEPVTVNKEKGFVACFPAYVLHRVTPVTKGTRRTLVVWISGPDFR